MIFARIFFALFAALLAIILTFLVELALLMAVSEFFDLRITPRGVGWVIIPILGGIAAWKAGWRYDEYSQWLAKKSKWLFETRKGRISVVASTIWFFSWTIYCLNSDNFRSYAWREDDWLSYFGGLFGFPAIALVLYLSYQWVQKGKVE